MTEREKIARMINPGAWQVMDAELASMKRKYAGKNAGYDPDQFKHKESIALAERIIAALDGGAVICEGCGRIGADLPPAPQQMAATSPLSLELFDQWFKPKIDTAKDPQSEYWQCWQDAVTAANGFAQQPEPRDRDLALIEFVRRNATLERYDNMALRQVTDNELLAAFLATQELRG